MQRIIQNILRAGVALAVVGLGMFCLPQQTAANGKAEIRSRIDQFEKILKKQKQGELNEIALQAQQRAMQWLEDVRVLVAEQQMRQAKRLLKRVEMSIELIEAHLKAERLRKQADTRQETYHHLKNSQLPDLKAKLEKLQAEKQQLTGQTQSSR